MKGRAQRTGPQDPGSVLSPNLWPPGAPWACPVTSVLHRPQPSAPTLAFQLTCLTSDPRRPPPTSGPCLLSDSCSPSKEKLQRHSSRRFFLLPL